MKAIVTVTGLDRTGIIAEICTLLAAHNINILDINQTVMENFFTMTMLVDTTLSTQPFAELNAELSLKGEEMKLSVRIQREDIFYAMNEI